MRLENELKGERMVTPGIETGPRIVHIDRGSSYPWSEISETGMWTPFAIDAKGGEMKTKGEHAHRGSMSCCHQWQRGRLLMKLSLMPTWSLACGGCPWLEVEALVLIESMKEPLKMPWWRTLKMPSKVGTEIECRPRNKIFFKSAQSNTKSDQSKFY